MILADWVFLVPRIWEGIASLTKTQAVKLAARIASKSPVAVLGTKEIINYSRDKTVEEGLRYTAVWNMAMLQTGDVQDAMLSGMQKKVAKFSKL